MAERRTKTAPPSRPAKGERISDRLEFRLPPDRWNAFVEMLDRPPVDKPRLRRFLTQPSIFER